MLRMITNNFAVLTVLGVALAWFYPPSMTWMTNGSIQVAGQPLLSVALGLIMLAMGLTLTFEDYARLTKLPKAVAIGVALQFIVMPLAGFTIAWGLQLEQGLAVGLILVACCPGGTASNIVAYLARGNVALSVAMTMVSTLAAIALTPLLTGELAGTYVEIDRWNLLRNMVAIVLVPLITLACVMLLASRIAWRLWGDEEAIFTALVIVISIPVLFQLSPMRIDHHGWQMVCALAALNGLLARSPRVGGWDR